MLATNIRAVIQRIDVLVDALKAGKVHLIKCQNGIDTMSPTELKKEAAMTIFENHVADVSSAYSELQSAVISTDPIIDTEEI